MILRAFKDKFIRLAREEDGVALVVTLAVFFFIYLICMGVYAVGTNVRERIHLQNACDAAAYSAAVVQADTLSRIATINRAMSWTYVQMTRRQMDYIVYKWLRHTENHYDIDKSTAINWYNKGTHCPLHSWWKVWDGEVPPLVNGATERVTINWKPGILLSTIRSDANNFVVDQIRSHRASFYAALDFEKQIAADKNAIDAMNNAERWLAENLVSNINLSVRGVLIANLGQDATNSLFCVQQESPLDGEYQSSDGDAKGYLTHLHNTSSDESRLVSFCGETSLDEVGLDRWYVRGNGLRSTEGLWDIQRSYKHWERDILLSQWYWSAAYSVCRHETVWHHAPAVEHTGNCGHSHTHDTCGRGAQHNANCYGDNESSGEPTCWTELTHIGEQAQPLIMRENYCGKAGTISVGLARKNENPVTRMIRGAVGDLDGIFAAFNPFVEWTFAFASAKAGYRRWKWNPDASGYLPVEDDREYRIDWYDKDERGWNLYTSDWDAVLIPVRMAGSQAEVINGQRKWNSGDTKFFNSWVSESWQSLNGGETSVDTQLRAGGKRSQLDDWAVLRNESAPDQQWWNWKTPLVYQTNEDAANRVDVEWQIGSPGGRIDWEHLAERMFH